MSLLIKIGVKQNKNKAKQPPPLPATPAALIAVAPDQEWVGWRIATFAAETLMSTPGIKTSSTAVWRAYLGWCREGKRVPLAMNVFLKRFDELVEEVGIGRFQNGAHVLYRDLTLRKA
jgi:hypothetical protein